LSEYLSWQIFNLMTIIIGYFILAYIGYNAYRERLLGHHYLQITTECCSYDSTIGGQPFEHHALPLLTEFTTVGNTPRSSTGHPSRREFQALSEFLQKVLYADLPPSK
jgi:hypothetical protein